MKILQLCNKPPYPSVDGGMIAMQAITSGLLQAKHEVKVFAISTKKHPVKIETLNETYLKSTSFEHIFVKTDVTPFGIIKNFFQSGSYNIERFYSKKYENRLIEILKSATFDIVQLESLFMAPYIECIRANSSAKIILRSHNAEFKIWERRAANTPNQIKKWYLNFLTKP